MRMVMAFTGLTPNVFTNDIARATAFYRDVLGFTVTTTVPDKEPHVFVWLQRDAVSVFLNDAPAARHESPSAPIAAGAAGIGLFIVMDAIADYWNQIKDRAPVVMALKDQWYGMTEFTITDPDGYLVTFAERRAQ